MLDARRLRPNGRDVEGLSRFGARSGASDTPAAAAAIERDEPERAVPARLPPDDDAGSARLAAQCVVIESILSKRRLWSRSNAALEPLLGEAGRADDDEPKRVEPLRGRGAVARDSAARRFISARMSDMVEEVAALSVAGGWSARADEVELVEAKRVPGIVAEKVKVGAGGAAEEEGEPKMKAGPEVGRAGGGESSDAMVVSATVERDETRRMPPLSSSSVAELWSSSSLGSTSLSGTSMSAGGAGSTGAAGPGCGSSSRLLGSTRARKSVAPFSRIVLAKEVDELEPVRVLCAEPVPARAVERVSSASRNGLRRGRGRDAPRTPSSSRSCAAGIVAPSTMAHGAVLASPGSALLRFQPRSTMRRPCSCRRATRSVSCARRGVRVSCVSLQHCVELATHLARALETEPADELEELDTLERVEGCVVVQDGDLGVAHGGCNPSSRCWGGREVDEGLEAVPVLSDSTTATAAHSAQSSAPAGGPDAAREVANGA